MEQSAVKAIKLLVKTPQTQQDFNNPQVGKSINATAVFSVRHSLHRGPNLLLGAAFSAVLCHSSFPQNRVCFGSGRKPSLPTVVMVYAALSVCCYKKSLHTLPHTRKGSLPQIQKRFLLNRNGGEEWKCVTKVWEGGKLLCKSQHEKYKNNSNVEIHNPYSGIAILKKGTT